MGYSVWNRAFRQKREASAEVLVRTLLSLQAERPKHAQPYQRQTRNGS